jgi:uncharacterized integral membrane protein
MRIVRFLIAYAVFSTFGIVMSLFIAQNSHAEHLAFFGQDISTNLAWIMIGATACGFLVALVLLVPGRLAATLHIWSLHREARDFEEHLALQEDRLAMQGERRERLLDRHERLLEGHERLVRAYQRVADELDQVIGERNALQTRLAATVAVRGGTVSGVGTRRPAERDTRPRAVQTAQRPQQSGAVSAAEAPAPAAAPPVAPAPAAPMPVAPMPAAAPPVAPVPVAPVSVRPQPLSLPPDPLPSPAFSSPAFPSPAFPSPVLDAEQDEEEWTQQEYDDYTEDEKYAPPYTEEVEDAGWGDEGDADLIEGDPRALAAMNWRLAPWN